MKLVLKDNVVLKFICIPSVYFVFYIIFSNFGTFIYSVKQGCTTYLKARATNKSGTKVEGHNRWYGGCASSGVQPPGAKLLVMELDKSPGS